MSDRNARLEGYAGPSSDGHTRITKIDGESRICGGDRDSHERMVETTIKLHEGLKRDGKRLADVQDGSEMADRLNEAERRTGR